MAEDSLDRPFLWFRMAGLALFAGLLGLLLFFSSLPERRGKSENVQSNYDLSPPAQRNRIPPSVADALPPASNTPQVVVFWASWCQPCLADLPEMAGWQKDLELRAGTEIPWHLINIDDEASWKKAQRLLGQLAPGYPFLRLRPEEATAMDIEAIPSYWVIDRQERLAMTGIGPFGRSLLTLTQAITELIQETGPPTGMKSPGPAPNKPAEAVSPRGQPPHPSRPERTEPEGQ